MPRCLTITDRALAPPNWTSHTVTMPGGGFSRMPPSLKAQDVQPDGRFTLGNFSIDEYKPIKVIVIGASFSGILAGIRCVSRVRVRVRVRWNENTVASLSTLMC